MDTEERQKDYEEYEAGSADTHKAARPMIFFRDKDGEGWLCDKGVDLDGDLEAQGCWRCSEVTFPIGH